MLMCHIMACCILIRHKHDEYRSKDVAFMRWSVLCMILYDMWGDVYDLSYLDIKMIGLQTWSVKFQYTLKP